MLIFLSCSLMGVGSLLLTEDLTKVQKIIDISKIFLKINKNKLISKNYCENEINKLSLLKQLKIYVMKIEYVNKLKALYLGSFNINETMQQLRAGGVIKLMSWAARGFVNCENKGLLFRVSGYKHKGYVFITLDFDDTYTVHLLNMKCDIIKTMEMVYCDQLTDIIDNSVEKVDNYNEAVKKTYGWK